MRIASNKLSDLLAFYHSELFSVYAPSELEAVIRIVCKHYLGFSPADIITKKNEGLNQSDVLKLYDCCKELKKNIPLQYILGETFFYGSVFKVNNSVLIPRPETEELVDLILMDCKSSGNEALDILDIGTGSGCIPVTLKKELSESNVSAVDISEEALKVAHQNALLNNATVLFGKCDILKQEAQVVLDKYDIIVSNPPYIAKKEASQMHERVKNNEPTLALFVDDDDTIIFYKRIIDICKEHLNSGGHLYFELNPVFANDVKHYAEKSETFASVNLINDLSGNIRFLKAERHE